MLNVFFKGEKNGWDKVWGMRMIRWRGKVEFLWSIETILTLNYNYDVCHCFGDGENVMSTIPNDVEATPPSQNLKLLTHLATTLNPKP